MTKSYMWKTQRLHQNTVRLQEIKSYPKIRNVSIHSPASGKDKKKNKFNQENEASEH